MQENYFNLLGLPIDATAEEIRAAYYECARKFHPDKNSSSEAIYQFQLVQDAFQTLSDEARKADYIQQINAEHIKSPLRVKKAFSAKNLTLVNEKQLLYILMELDCTDVDSTKRSLPLTISLVVDRSTSMAGARLTAVKNQIIHLAEQLRPGDMISVIGINDFPEEIVPLVKAGDFCQFRSKISNLKAQGGTEIFKGLELSYNSIMKHSVDSIRRIVLLTDGHTYGDEQKCLELSEKAAKESVSIYALGFGDQWNDAFLDELTVQSGGSAAFIQNDSDLENFLKEQVFSAANVYAQQLQIEYKPQKNIRLNDIFRLAPDASPLLASEKINLGNINNGQRMLFLFEFIIDELPSDCTDLSILDGKVIMRINSSVIQNERHFINWSRPVVRSFHKEVPPESLVNAISRLTLYRMQEKAKDCVKNKHFKQASQKLLFMASQLSAQGEKELAKTVMFEAQNIEKTGNFSIEGDKRIKYGTRALLLQSGLES